jgi:hypothetical protein
VLYKDDWLLWRTLGYTDADGMWIAPVSFLEAQSLPKAMLNVFLQLDDILFRMQQQILKKKRPK